MGPAFAGIEARAGNALPMPLSRGGADPVPVRRFLQLETPLVLVRHAMPWVVWQVEPVAEIVSPAPVSRYRGLSALLEHSSVEAAFVVTIDTTGCWQLSRLRPLRGDGHGAPPRRSSRRY
jgi:hypothetical protein